jgi:putative FmdB family regulatory protein
VRYTAVMPLFEYTCADCGKSFELLMREGVTPVCPACRGERVEKQLSAFAVGAGAPKASPMPAGGPCAGCQNPAACGFGNN